jgi:FkbM family methyltransferase
MRSYGARFRNLRDNGINISYALDIGAYRGDFSKILREIWPNINIWQFEADERQKPWLDPNAIFGLLSDKPNVSVDFFTLDNENSITTGSSMYRELTSYYKNPIVVKKKTKTLDSIMDQVNFRGNWKNAGLIKLDTQGSELDILKGGEKFLSTFKPKYILIETSVIRYNENAPLVGEVIEYMRMKNYHIVDILNYQYENNGKLLQMDILFGAP